MATKPGVWGLDLGQCALKAIRLELIDGQVTATAFDYIEHPKILSQPDVDPDQLTREALEQFLSRNQLQGDTVVISVPGQTGLARFVKLPPVEEKKIADIVRFEAKQQIPFPLEEVAWDFQKIGQGTVTDGFAMETEIGLFAMKRDLINRYLQHFQDVNVEVHIVQMAPLGLCNFVSYDLLGKEPGLGDADEGEEQKECIIALDIGTDSSNLVITDGGKIIWQRSIPLGGNNFTRALTKDLKLTFAKAEHLKRNAVKSPELKKILGALKPVLNDFVGEVQRSLGFFTNAHRNAQIAYLVGVGNAFRLPGLQKYLQEKLQLEVRKLSKMERLSGDNVLHAPQFTENLLSLAVAYGMALQGLHLTQLQTNLLPQEIRTERLVRAKKPWAAAAAAVLLLAVAGLTFGRHLEQQKVKNPEIEKALKRATQSLDNKTRIEKDYGDKLKKIEEAKAAVRRIRGGVEERFNWQLLLRYVNNSLPRPNGDKVTATTRAGRKARQRYGVDNDQSEGIKAHRLIQIKRFAEAQPVVAGIKPNEDQEEFVKKYLVQLNIESISSLYEDDLLPYFGNLVKATNMLRGFQPDELKLFDQKKEMVKEESKDKLPKKGWVVEIRGYTYHHDGQSLVEDTVMENLGNPEGVGNTLSPDTKKQIKEQMGFLVLYQCEKVHNPEPGVFKFIKSSALPTLLGGGGQAGGVKGFAAPRPGEGLAQPGAPPMEGGAPAGGEGAGTRKASRDAWRPVGDIAAASLGAGGGGLQGLPGHKGAPGVPMPPMKGGGDVAPPAIGKGDLPAAGIRQPRTEFIILFVWKEPTGEAPPPAEEATKN